jgi:hypothetical protein
MELLLPAPDLAGDGVEKALLNFGMTLALALADGSPNPFVTESLQHSGYRALHRRRQTPAYIHGWRFPLATYDQARAKNSLRISGRFGSRVISPLPTDAERSQQSEVLRAEFRRSETKVASVGRGADL